MGFRPGEAVNARHALIVQGKLLLRQVITKTEKFGPKIQSPIAPLSLKVLTRVESELGLGLNKGAEDLLSLLNPPLRALRTTAACHLLYSGANIEVVRQRLGHTSLEMVVRHYNAFPVPDVGSLTPEAYYGLPKALRVNGTDLFDVERLPWDRWVLLQAISICQRHLDANEFAQVKTWVLEEAGALQIMQRQAVDF